MIKPIVVVFILLEVDVTLGGGLWDQGRLAQVQGSEMSQGLFHYMVFVAGVTQENEGKGSAQDFILLFWCKSGELGSRESPRYLCVTMWWQTSPQTFFML